MKREEFVALAMSYLDFPATNYGGPLSGMSKEGFDCSGLINFLLKSSGYPGNVPRHANELFDEFGVTIHEEFQQPADLVFFSNRGGYYPDHVGIMISENEYIHSPGRNGKVVCVSVLEKVIIKPAEEKLQIYFSNPIGFKRIAVKSGRYQKSFFRD